MSRSNSAVVEARPGILTPAGFHTYAALRSDELGLRGVVPEGGVVALRTDDPAVVIAAIVALDGHASAVHLLPDGVDVDLGPTARHDLGNDGSAPAMLRVAQSVDERVMTGTRFIVYTSGTTGRPKPVDHPYRSLARTTRRHGLASELVWGLLYDPNRMAGLQVLVQGLESDRTTVTPWRSWRLRDRVLMLMDAGVTALSATPTLWRQILQLPDIGYWELRQITLGGEIVDQRILDALASIFPQARISHVFASTETGAAFTVSDGIAGFPVSYLSDPPAGIELAIRDNILQVRNQDSGCAAEDGFVSTGDVVEQIAGRVLFKGRASGVVNVGGANVWPEEIERVIRDHPDVREVVVRATPNPLAGNLLVAEIVPQPGADVAALRRGLRKWVRERAPAAAVPAQVRIADDVTSADTGKVRR